MNEFDVKFKGGSQKRYVVTFDGEDVVSIHSVVRLSDCKSHHRLFWHKENGKPLNNIGLVVVGKAKRDEWVPKCG